MAKSKDGDRKVQVDSAWREYSRLTKRTAAARQAYYGALDAEHRAYIAYQNVRFPVEPPVEHAKKGL